MNAPQTHATTEEHVRIYREPTNAAASWAPRDEIVKRTLTSVPRIHATMEPSVKTESTHTLAIANPATQESTVISTLMTAPQVPVPMVVPAQTW